MVGKLTLLIEGVAERGWNWTLGPQGNDDQEGRSELIPRDG